MPDNWVSIAEAARSITGHRYEHDEKQIAFLRVLEHELAQWRLPWRAIIRRMNRKHNAKWALHAAQCGINRLAINWAVDAGADRDALVTAHMLIYGEAPPRT